MGNAMEFNTTRWSIVVASGNSDDEVSRQALEELSKVYWLPVYLYTRSRGLSREDAEDATQAFFAHFLSTDGFSQAEAKRGSFRSFLLGSVKNFLIDEWKKNGALKRGFGLQPVYLDFERAENLAIDIVDSGRTPEQDYDYCWGRTIMARALNRVRELYSKKKRTDVFDVLRQHLEVSSAKESYRKSAELLGMSENAVKVAVHRLREQYRAALNHEMRDTLVVDHDLESEKQHLIDIVST